MSISRIGVLSAGGDCPGINAVIRAVTKTAIYKYNLEVIGIEDGFLGLIEQRYQTLVPDDVSNILTLGGTILGTNNRTDPSRYPVEIDGKVEFQDVRVACKEFLDSIGVEVLIVIGGDGSMSVASKLIEVGITCMGVPKTIDNDLAGTDITFGFATARDVAAEALDRIHTTAASHHRAMLVEVMGRNAGWIALQAGVAAGADVILIPEIPYDLDKVCEHLTQRAKHHKRFSIISVSEGAKPIDGDQVVEFVDPLNPDPIRLGGVSRKLAKQIHERTEIETRTVILGHTQRGGTPAPQDRVLGTMFGSHAVHCMMKGKVNRIIVMKGRTPHDIAIEEVANKQRLVPLDHPILVAARGVGTCFGD